jgi:adenine-specific DNA methylase
MYAVCSQVPVRLTYRNGDVTVRYLWRFRAPTQADLDAVQAAKEELARLRPRWEVQDLMPTEEVPEDMEDKRPREYGMPHWRDLFLPRQLLTNVVILEEIRAAQARARAELPEDEAEAVSVYLAFILSKVVNYNSVNTFWHYGRLTVAQTFSRHDFAFRPAFCEFEGARETVLWGASQVIGAYEQLARLIHGESVSLEGADEEGEADEALDEDVRDEATNDQDEGESQAAITVPEHNGEGYLRPEVIVPTVTCDDAAALSVPAPGTVHLICVDPPYYNNVQYAELSNFFYVWLKRALHDWPGLAHLFRESLAESNREAVANAARWQREADAELAAWQARYDAAVETLRAQNVKVREARTQALAMVGPKPLSAKERADRFYEDKMAAVFRRARQLLHPAGRMVVMFNHKETWAWRSLGMALIRWGIGAPSRTVLPEWHAGLPSASRSRA